MLNLAKYLKPFLISVLITIALLFAQAMCDLNLPKLMSDIVNIGIQQSGIQNSAPNAISQESMKLIQAFMTNKEQEIINTNYSLVSVESKDVKGKAYSELYPKAQGQIYVKNKTTVEELDSIFDTIAYTLISVLQKQFDNTGTDTQIDFSQISAVVLPQDIGEIRKTSPNEMMQKQSGIMLAKAFYSELGGDLSKAQQNYIMKMGMLMVLVTLLGGITMIFSSLFSTRIAAGLARNLRSELFEKVENFSNAEMDKFSTASLITRCTNDVTQIQQFFTMGTRMICYAPMMGIGGIIMAVSTSSNMSWIIIGAVVLLISFIVVVMLIAMPKFKIIQKLVDNMNLVARESLSGMMVIRAFGNEEHEQKRFDNANIDLTKTGLFINRVMVLMMPVVTLLMNGVTVLIVWVGARHIANSSIQVGDMMAFMQYAMQIIMSFLMFSIMFIMLPRAAVSAERIAEALAIEISIKDPENPKEFDTSKKGLIEFKNVHFRYPSAESDTVYNINFTAKSGQTTAIIGPTGSGKSTIVNLLMRFYDISRGHILVDGVDIRQVTQKNLRSRIGYVPQKGILISGTIESNLKYGNKEASIAEVGKAAEIAQAKEFIEKLEGLSTTISQGGSNVSGGQKQRLSIARALVKNPEIIIFDDSFSALDFKTDAVLRNALKEHTSTTTQIVVAQRVGTIMNADQIIVLDKGKIVGHGTHKELLKSCPEYYEIALSQLSEEELA